MQQGSLQINTRSISGQLSRMKVFWFPVAFSDNAAGQGFSHLEFKIVVEPPDGQSFSIVLLAPSRQEKAAWTSDISQVQTDSEELGAAMAGVSCSSKRSFYPCFFVCVCFLSTSVHR